MTDTNKPMVRRVITGVNQKGESIVIEDLPCTTVATTPMFDAVDIWRIAHVPTRVGTQDFSIGEVVLEPPNGGLLVRAVTFHPDSTWQNSDYKEAFSAIKGGDAHSDDSAAGMHATNTVDVAYVVSGEIVALLQTKDVVLHAGDSLIQQGTQHAWSNRTSKPAVVLFTQVSANH